MQACEGCDMEWQDICCNLGNFERMSERMFEIVMHLISVAIMPQQRSAPKD